MTILTLIKLITSISIPWGLGFVFQIYLFRRSSLSWPLHIALAYGTGFGFLSVWMLLLGMFKIPFTFTNIAIPLVCLTGLFVWLTHQKQKSSPATLPEKTDLNDDNSTRPSSPVYAILKRVLCLGMIMYIGLNLTLIFWEALTIPIVTWDAVATIAFKAKIFFYEKGLPPLALLPHKTYPLLIPFAETWTALTLGEWNDQWIKIIFPLACVNYLIIQYRFLQEYSGKTWALIGCVLLLSSNLFMYHAMISYRDFFLMMFNCTTIILLLLWADRQEPAYLTLAGFYAAMAAFTKLEGSAFLIIYLIILAVIHMRKPANLFRKTTLVHMIRFAWLPLLTSVIFHVYKVLEKATIEGAGNRDKTKIDFTLDKLSLIPHIFEKFVINLIYTSNWNLVWLILLLSIAHYPAKFRDLRINILLLCLILFIGLYSMVGLLTVNYFWIFGEKGFTGLSRLILHFFPLVVMAVVLLNAPRSSTQQ